MIDLRNFDDMIADLKRITLMERDEIINFVNSSVISYGSLRGFYLRYGRLPSQDECRLIRSGYL